VGLHHQRRHQHHEQYQRHRGRRHFRAPGGFCKQPRRITTKAGFADSDAWILTPISVIQRREPLTSGPTSSVATMSAIEIANTISALRRIWRGDMKETPTSTMKDAAGTAHGG